MEVLMATQKSGFEEFCGDAIFNESLLLNSHWPHFTECFQHSLLVWIPCGFLWVTLPFYLIYMFRYHQGNHIPVNKHNIAKTFISTILCILSAVQLLQLESDGGKDDDSGEGKVYDVVYVAGGLKAITYLLSAILVQIERIKGVTTTGILWIFWLMSVLANIIPFYSKIYLRDYETMHFTFYIFYIIYAFLLVQLVLSSFAESMHHDGYYHMGDSPFTRTRGIVPESANILVDEQTGAPSLSSPPRARGPVQSPPT